jgi:hypothetical protein
MVFGDRNSFAIEAEVEPSLVPPSAVWGRICVWCAGEALGRCDEGMNSLYGSMCAVRWMRDNLDRLWDEPLRGLDDAAAFELLEGVSFFMDGKDRVEFRRYDKFDFLVNWCESFDGWHGFVICPPGEAVTILFRRPDRSRASVRVPRAEFVAAADGFVRWFEAQAARLSPSE